LSDTLVKLGSSIRAEGGIHSLLEAFAQSIDISRTAIDTFDEPEGDALRQN
jgi:hypothetical protein